MKVCVVIRHLKGCVPTTHCVIVPPAHQLDDLSHYFTEKSKEEIEKFKETFVEFRQADFYNSIVDTI